MPLEIRELVIRVNIEEDNKKSNVEIKDELQVYKRGIIEECVEVILQKLEDKQDR